MTTIVATSDQLVADVDGPSWASGNIPYRQSLPTGATISWGWASGAQASGSNDFDASVYDVASGSPVSLLGGVQTWSGTSGGASYSVTLAGAADVALLLIAGGAGGHHSAGTLFGFHAEVTTPGGFCAYGARQTTSSQYITVITTALVDAAVAILGGGLLMVLAFDTLIGAPLLLGDLCSSGPPDVPTFSNDDFIPGTQIWSPGSFSKRLQAFRAAVWSFYCECVPAPGGSPAPVPYPHPPVIPAPIGGQPIPPPLSCDQADICSMLNSIMRQLAATNAQLSFARSDIQLIQRQGVPFGYVRGTVHAGLTNFGEFAVHDILGLAVTMTGVTPTSAPGDPVTYHQVGKISTGTADGWQRSWMPTHDPYMILDISGTITKIGYVFAPGVTASITELVREP